MTASMNYMLAVYLYDGQRKLTIIIQKRREKKVQEEFPSGNRLKKRTEQEKSKRPTAPPGTS